MERSGKRELYAEAERHSIAGMLRDGEILTEELPYDKFERAGAEALTDAELLAIIIRTGSGGLTPMEIGRRILNREKDHGGLSNLYRLSLAELQQIPGIGRVKAVKLKCIAELSKRIAGERTRPLLAFTDPGRVAKHYMERMRHEDREIVLLLSLNSRMRLLAESVLSIGTVNRSLVTPREIFLEALKNGAVNVILLHNHPGGDPMPGRADRKLTEQAAAAGQMIGITLADHLVIGDKDYFSFRQHDLIEP